jgi:hypothetical protein
MDKNRPAPQHGSSVQKFGFKKLEKLDLISINDILIVYERD